MKQHNSGKFRSSNTQKLQFYSYNFQSFFFFFKLNAFLPQSIFNAVNLNFS